MLPSQARDQLLLIAARASEMKNEDSLKIFRQAQRYCYDEMQRIHMPLFVQDELLKAGQPPKRVRYIFIYIYVTTFDLLEKIKFLLTTLFFSSFFSLSSIIIYCTLLPLCYVSGVYY